MGQRPGGRGEKIDWEEEKGAISRKRKCALVYVSAQQKGGRGMSTLEKKKKSASRVRRGKEKTGVWAEAAKERKNLRKRKIGGFLLSNPKQQKRDNPPDFSRVQGRRSV